MVVILLVPFLVIVSRSTLAIRRHALLTFAGAGPRLPQPSSVVAPLRQQHIRGGPPAEAVVRGCV
jgi:hypothetical protein